MNKEGENNKDYILNIRISRKTYEKVKGMAKENRESVSHLVRKVIDDCLEIGNDLSEEIFGKKKENNIFTYYNGVTAKDMSCSECGDNIKSGKTIIIGETNKGKKYYFCSKCK